MNIGMYAVDKDKASSYGYRFTYTNIEHRMFLHLMSVMCILNIMALSELNSLAVISSHRVNRTINELPSKKNVKKKRTL